MVATECCKMERERESVGSANVSVFTLHVKQEAHEAAAAVDCVSVPKSGVSVPPSAASPYLRPVLGLTNASTAVPTALAMIGRLEKVVKISAPDKWNAVKVTKGYRR